MSNNKQAKGYQRISSFQREDEKQLIENVQPCLGDTILDLGCGAGELSVYLPELVGEHGKVVAVDPDIDRIKVAQESHKGVKNATFIEGSTGNFPGMGLKTYDIVFANYVLHWIPDKGLAFKNQKNMFSSLKPGGKIALQFNHHIPSLNDHAYRELNPENLERIQNMYHLKTRPEVEQMCIAAGFDIVKSYDVKRNDLKIVQVYAHFSGQHSTHGAFDPRFVTEDRLTEFCSRYARKEAGAFRFFAEEGDSHSALVAVKPAI